MTYGFDNNSTAHMTSTETMVILPEGTDVMDTEWDVRLTGAAVVVAGAQYVHTFTEYDGEPASVRFTFYYPIKDQREAAHRTHMVHALLAYAAGITDLQALNNLRVNTPVPSVA